MNLAQLTEGMPELIAITQDAQTQIDVLTADSRAKCHNGLFFCIRGGRVDAHEFAPQAIANGCCALVVERRLELDCPQVVVSDVRAAMTRMASTFNGHPERRMKLIGITGTKGKTTTTYLLRSVIEAAGMRCGIIGTTGCIAGQTKLPSHLTTPDPIEMFEILRIMADAGVEVVCMEVSAHALYLRKLVGVVFEAAAYTNLSQDHLDFFGTMEHYFAAKRMLFADNMVRNAAVNVDEETAQAVCEGISCPLLTYGISSEADLFARDIEITESGVSFTLNLRNLHTERIHLLLTGMFNVYNALAAAACALILGVSLEDIRKGLEAVVSVPGRVEMLDTRTPYRMILDYSHSPDALENILRTVREFCRGHLILVFGCGGDRDKGKRPMMGEIAGRLADFVILTSDNPRYEDPMAILAAIERGIKPTGARYEIIENRRMAIRQAMEIAVGGDIIVLAGKGHETYQDIAGVKHPFDEKVVVAELLDEIAAEQHKE
ncbi:MAG TPA: UDP-N-acetylmuramoyl-L-alanyl-D-glutamate--2,6-diaminopimelate ligase [Candidatus Ventricola gallistercoris]|nr:UDP-N-acetylmuramoyl-L-alanyl-D-glutamate--2,6-diaminopimelate ligase [Candidatus Ventricola gallistercoris]